MEIGLISIMKHVQECKNIRAGAMIVIFNYREDEKQERNKCKTSASESAAFQVLQQPAVADISGRLEEGFWQTQLSLNHQRVMDAAEEGLVTRRGGWTGRGVVGGDARCSLLHLQCRWVGMLGGARKGEQIWQHHLFGAGKLQSSMDLSWMHWGLWEFKKERDRRWKKWEK